MTQSTKEIIRSLIHVISSLNEVQSIGISGYINTFPRTGEGDVDIFIYCETIPKVEVRQVVMKKMEGLLKDSEINAFEGGHWGTGDFSVVNGVEVWLMYFTTSKALKEVESILNGDYPDKLDNYYYPVGRCAMLKDINILCDKNGFLKSLKERLVHYPEILVKTLSEYHMEELEDREDLERAVSRKDVLFYHFALDITIDHYLQALFALNRTFFPSRKRTLSFIENFSLKPENCNEKLLEVIKYGGYAEGISQSYKLLCEMIEELKQCR